MSIIGMRYHPLVAVDTIRLCRDLYSVIVIGTKLLLQKCVLILDQPPLIQNIAFKTTFCC